MPTFLDQEIGVHLAGGTVALGFFDGCHVGHQEILKTCFELGAEKAAVFTFPNHPTTAIPGRAAPQLVTTSKERIELLENLGLRVFLKTFDRDFSSWNAEYFVSEILNKRLGVEHVVVGHDYRFGHRAAGDVGLLRSFGDKYGFDCTVIDAIMHEGEEPFVVSSTRIRQAVAEGELLLASHLMGRPFFFSATVIRGRQKGRTIGFPTANLSYPEGKVEPPYGVFSVKVSLPDGLQVNGIANFGLRPTVEEEEKSPLFEVHLFDFDRDLYGVELRVELCSFVRSEKKFDSFDDLQRQILQDVTEVRAFF